MQSSLKHEDHYDPKAKAADLRKKDYKTTYCRQPGGKKSISRISVV